MENVIDVEDDNHGPCKVFVGNIADDVEVDLIKEEFGQFGEIIEISFDIASAYISYASKTEANNAIDAMDGKEFMGEKIRVEFSSKRPRSPEVRFSGNFDYTDRSRSRSPSPRRRSPSPRRSYDRGSPDAFRSSAQE